LSDLNRLSRATQPLQAPEVSVVLELPRNLAGGERFLEALKALGKELSSKPHSRSQQGADYFVTSLRDGQPTSFSITENSRLFPRHDAEPELHVLLAQTGVEMTLFRDAKSLGEARDAFARNDKKPRLGYFGNTGDYAFGIGSDRSTRVEVQYNIETEQLFVWITGVPDERFIRKSGSMISVPDLEEAFVLLAVDHSMVPQADDVAYSALRVNRNAMTASTAFISTNGRKYILRSWETQSNAAGYKVFSIGPIGEHNSRRDEQTTPLARSAASGPR
jgi:hypothetical protein